MRIAAAALLGEASSLCFPRSMSVKDNLDVVRKLGEALTNRDWTVFDGLVVEDCDGRTFRAAERSVVTP